MNCSLLLLLSGPTISGLFSREPVSMPLIIFAILFWTSPSSLSALSSLFSMTWFTCFSFVFTLPSRNLLFPSLSTVSIIRFSSSSVKFSAASLIIGICSVSFFAPSAIATETDFPSLFLSGSLTEGRSIDLCNLDSSVELPVMILSCSLPKQSVDDMLFVFGVFSNSIDCLPSVCDSNLDLSLIWTSSSLFRTSSKSKFALLAFKGSSFGLDSPSSVAASCPVSFGNSTLFSEILWASISTVWPFPRSAMSLRSLSDSFGSLKTLLLVFALLPLLATLPYSFELSDGRFKS